MRRRPQVLPSSFVQNVMAEDADMSRFKRWLQARIEDSEAIEDIEERKITLRRLNSALHEAQSFSDLVALSSGIISAPFVERDANVRPVEIPSARNPDPTVCPSCGEKVSSDLGFCPLCGTYRES